MACGEITDEEDETLAATCCCCAAGEIPLLRRPRPIEVSGLGAAEQGQRRRDGAFWAWPLTAPLVFVNEGSDCRDHCANERTFLSYVRLSIYSAVVSAAILVSFHLKHTATEIELRMSKPLGIIFSALSIACLGVGLANYIDTVNKYSRKVAIVQTGWKTQAMVGILAASIVGSCITLLVVDKLS